MTPNSLMTVAVACRNANGLASLPLYEVNIPSDPRFSLRDAFDLAELAALKDGNEGPFVSFEGGSPQADALIESARLLRSDRTIDADGSTSMTMAVACTGPSGLPMLAVLQVSVSQNQYDLGEHFDVAAQKADLEGCTGPFVCFDDAEVGSIVEAANKLEPVPQPSMSELLVHAMYLGKGYLATPLTPEEVDRAQGESNAMLGVSDFAPAIGVAVAKADQQGFEFTGVFDYEVSEPMGEWLRATPNATPSDFLAELSGKLDAFFERDCSTLIEAAATTLSGYYTSPDRTLVAEHEDAPAI